MTRGFHRTKLRPRTEEYRTNAGPSTVQCIIENIKRTKVGSRTIPGLCGTLLDEVETSDFRRTKAGSRTNRYRTSAGARPLFVASPGVWDKS